MKLRLSRTILLSAIALTLAFTSAELRHIKGDLFNQVASLVTNMPRAQSGGFVPPTSADLADFAALVGKIQPGEVDAAADIAAVHDYELLHYTDRKDGRSQSYLLREVKPIRTGWGLYVFRIAPAADVIIEAPHPLADEGSEMVALDAYRTLHARALLIAGAHRAADPDGSADVAHNRQTVFQAIHEALTASGTPVVLQFHGFAASSHPGYPQVVLGGEPATDRQLLTELAQALEVEGVSSGTCDGTAWTDLCGEANVQSTTVGSGSFIHLELSESIRTQDEALLAALEQVF